MAFLFDAMHENSGYLGVIIFLLSGVQVKQSCPFHAGAG